MTGLRDFVVYDGQKYQVDPKSCVRGTVKPFIPLFSVGDKNFTGGTPPFTPQGQRMWDGGFQQKYAKDTDNNSFRTSKDVDFQFGDRVLLANSFSGTIYNTAQNEVKLVQTPFADTMFAYSTGSNNVWYKAGASAWAAATIPSTGTFATAPTGWLSDCIGTINDGTVQRIDVTGGGSGYGSAPTVTLTGGGGSGATATATITNGVVTSIAVTAAGTGYLSAPVISFSGGGGGTGATAAAVLAGTPYLLLGSKNGHVMKCSLSGAATGTFTEVGRPVQGSDDFYKGIYCMTMFQGVLYLGGQSNASTALLATWDVASTTTRLIKKFGTEHMNGSSRVETLIRRYVDSDNTPDQLHWTVTNTGTATGDQAWHYMWPGTGNIHELRYWADNYPVCVCEYDVVGSKGLLFGMANFGIVWRFAGDYTQILRLDTPDTSYTGPINSLTQFGRFIVAPYQDATNGVSLLFYDGRGWWQGSATGSTYTGVGRSVSVYRKTVFLTHTPTPAAAAARIFELNTGANFASSGNVVTSLYDGGYPEIPKKWLKARLIHSPLRASESIQIERALDDAASGGGATSGAYSEDFKTTSYRDTANTTGVWDTANGRLTVQGMVEQNYVGKVTGSTVVSAHVAYAVPYSSPTTKTPATLIAVATEFTQAQYDNVEADDALAAQSGSTIGTANRSNVGDTNDTSISTSTWLSQSFSANATGTLSAVTVKGKTSGGTSYAVCSLYANSSDSPTGAPLATSDILTITNTTDAELTFTFSVGVTITNAVKYVLVWRQLQEAPGGGAPASPSSGSSPAAGTLTLRRGADDLASSKRGTSADSGVTWTLSNQDMYFKVFHGGTFGQAVQLFQFDVAGVSLNTIPLTYIGYGADTTGAANKGVTLYIWNALSQAWESQGTNSAGSADTDAVKTITATLSNSVTNYVDAASKIHILAVATYSGTNALASQLTSDFLRIDASLTTSLKTLRSTEVDTVTSGNITKATLTVTSSLAGGTMALFLSADGGTTWEAATSGSELTFATVGNQLKWRVDLTAASASARPAVTAITLSYVLPGAGTSAGWTSLGTNSTLSSTTTEFAFTDPTYSKLINFRFTLAGPGTTTPQVYRLAVEFRYAPDIKETFYATLVLEQNHDYSDGTSESRTPQRQYDDLLSVQRSKRDPAFTWITGDAKTSVTLETGNWAGDVSGVPADDDEEHITKLPVRLVEVAA